MAVVPQVGAQGLPENKLPNLFPPGLMGYNTPLELTGRRAMLLDHNGATRVAAQYEHDTGNYRRAAVGPVEYGEGNIKKSTAPTGPSGYNQRAVAFPDSADDMSQEEYGLSYLQSQPAQREKLRFAMALPKQRFLYRPTANNEYPLATHNMTNNLLALAKQRMGAKK